MSTLHGGPLPDVDNEGAANVNPDNITGLKVEDDSFLGRQNSETKSLSVVVIPESSVESHHVSGSDDISRPPIQKTVPFNLQPRIPDGLAIGKRTDESNGKDLIFWNENLQPQINREVLSDIASFDEKIVPVVCTGDPDSCETRPTCAVGVRCRPHPLDSSCVLCLLDTPSRQMEDRKALQKMWTCLSYLTTSFIFWMSDARNSQQTRLLESFVEARTDNEIEQTSEETKPIPNVKLVCKDSKTLDEHTQIVIKKLRDVSNVTLLEEAEQTMTTWSDLWSTGQDQEFGIWEQCAETTNVEITLNGRRFVQLLEACVDVENPSPDSKVQERFLSSVEAGLCVVVDRLTDTYHTMIRETTDTLIPVHQNVLDREHTRTAQQVIKQLSSQHLPSDDYFIKAKQQLEAKIEMDYQEIVEQNKKLSAEKCTLLVKQCFSEVQTKLDQRKYDIDSPQYQKDLEHAIGRYKNTPGTGPLADKVLVEFMKTLGKRGQSAKSDMEDMQSNPGAFSGSGTVKSRVIEMSPTSRPGSGAERNDDRVSMNIFLQVTHLEQKVEDLQEEVKRLQHIIQDYEARFHDLTHPWGTEIPSGKHVAQVESNTDEARLTTPVTSLTPEDTQWIHVEKQQNPQGPQDQTECVCKEISEKEVKLQSQNKRLREQIKELAEANSSWEKHCDTIQTGLSTQVTGLMQELHESKKQIRKLESRVENHDQQVTEIETEAHKQIEEAEEQKTKAISFASAQAEKVDELKRAVYREKQHGEALEKRVQELNAQVAALNQTADQYKSRTLQREMSMPRSSPRLPEEMLHLSTENRPPPGVDMQHQNSLQGSLWETLPPSLQMPTEAPKPCCRRLQQQLSQAEMEVNVLQQQVTIYKDDFIKERRDRENAHSEIASMRSSCVQLTDDMNILKDRLAKKSREVEALTTARAQDQHKIQEKTDHIERIERAHRADKNKMADLQAKVEQLRRQLGHQVHENPPPPYDAVPNPIRRDLDSVFLPRAWKDQLQRNYVTFANFLKTYEVVNLMYSQNLISFSDKVHLDAMQIESEKTNYLFNHFLTRMTRQELMTFKQILIDTNQHQLAQLLPSEDYTGPPWHCARCTYKNSPDRDRCEMCNKRAPHLGPLLGPPPVEQCDGDQSVDWVQPAREAEAEEDGETTLCKPQGEGVTLS